MRVTAATTSGLCAFLVSGGPAIGQMKGPNDIKELADLAASQAATFRRQVMDRATFYGAGELGDQQDRFGFPIAEVHFGAAGSAMCLGISTRGFKRGDRVVITGVVGSALSAAKIREINEVGAVGNTKTPPLPEKPSVSLVTGTCAIERAAR